MTAKVEIFEALSMLYDQYSTTEALLKTLTTKNTNNVHQGNTDSQAEHDLKEVG